MAARFESYFRITFEVLEYHCGRCGRVTAVPQPARALGCSECPGIFIPTGEEPRWSRRGEEPPQ